MKIIRYTSIAALTFAGLVAAQAPARAELIAGGQHPGTCLDMRGGSSDLILYACHGGSNQQFQFLADGTVRQQGRCLTAGTKAGDVLIMSSCVGDPAQRWRLHGDGSLRNGEGWCADVEEGGASGSSVLIWSCHPARGIAAANQRWARATFAYRGSLKNLGGGTDLAQRAAAVPHGSALRVSLAGYPSGGTMVLMPRGSSLPATGWAITVDGGVIVPHAGAIAIAAVR